MKITEITVSYGRTQSLEAYCNVRPSVTLKAVLDEGEDPEAARLQLLDEARAIVCEEVDRALEDDGKAAKYSKEPRFRLQLTSESVYAGSGWVSRRKTEAPEQLLVLLPNAVRLTKDTNAGHAWWNEPYGPSHNLRLAHARQAAADYLRDRVEAIRLIDCADGDLSKIPAWALTPPPEPEPVAAQAAAHEDEEGGEDE